MPTLLHQYEIKLEWADLQNWVQIPQPKNVRVRSKGVHLSGIIRGVMQARGKWTDRDDTDNCPINVVVGVAFENWAVGLPDCKEMAWQPGEWKKDGVFGTPDGVSELEPEEARQYKIVPDLHGLRVLEEFKATWRSAHQADVTGITYWMYQSASNCRAVGANVVRQRVLWVNGDYRPPSPRYCVYVIYFEPEEQEKIWRNVILKNRALAKAE